MSKKGRIRSREERKMMEPHVKAIAEFRKRMDEEGLVLMVLKEELNYVQDEKGQGWLDYKGTPVSRVTKDGWLKLLSTLTDQAKTGDAFPEEEDSDGDFSG